MSWAIYNDYSGFYDSIYACKDYIVETDRLGEILAAHGQVQGSRILDIGSGTGRHIEALQSRGFEVLGIEPSPSMAAVAIRRGANVKVGYVEEMAGNEGSYDVATALFAVLNHVRPSGLQQFFRVVGTLVREDGLVAVEIWSPESDAPKTTMRTFSHEGTEYVREVSPTRVADNAWSLAVTIKRGDSGTVVVQETHLLYKHLAQDIDLAAASAGLELVDSRPNLLNPADRFHETYVFRVTNR